MVFFGLSLLLAIPFFYKAIAFFVRRRLRSSLTAVEDIRLLAPKKGRKLPGTAVICGGSIGGLLSARVCSDHFENVVIVDPEAWIATSDGLHDHHRQASFQKRSRVPQYTSVHIYQNFTVTAMRKLFPEFEHEVRRQGARFMPEDLKMHYSGLPLLAPWHQYADGALPDTMFLSRPGYETVLRRLVLSTCANVKYVTASVCGLVPHMSSPNNIAAVLVRSQAGDETEMPASLIVDCTGPANGGLHWLQDFPLQADLSSNTGKTSLPLRELKTTYDHKMSYSTCEFDVPPTLFERLRAIGLPEDYETAGFLYVYNPDPKKDGRVFCVLRRERNFLQILCGGWGNRERMTGTSDIKSFVSQITSDRPLPDWICAMLTVLEEENVPFTCVYARCPPPVYVQYHRAAHLPSNFVALGDSVLQLNPIRGQGCTKACVDAVTLNAMLSRCAPVPAPKGDGNAIPIGFSRAFFATQAKRTGYLWDQYKDDDYAWKSTTPTKGEDLESYGAWARAFGAQIIQLAIRDRDVAAVLWHTTSWLEPRTDLFSPAILAKIVWMRFTSTQSIGL